MSGRNVDGGGGSGFGTTWNEHQDAAVFQVFGELLTCGGWVFIVDRKHRAALGALHVTAQGGVMGIVFLNQKRDGSAVELFFKMEELLKIESPRNRKKTGGGDAFSI